MKNNKGFTLLELMVVIAIIGIVTGMAVPSFSSMIERNKLKSAIQELQDDMQLARTRAIKQNQNIAVSVLTGNAGTWCYGLTTKATCTCTTANDCEIKTVSGAEFTPTNVTTAGSIVFDFRRGTVTPSVAAANTFIFTTNDYAVAVSTDVDKSADTSSDSGRVITCTPAVSGKIGLPNTLSGC